MASWAGTGGAGGEKTAGAAAGGGGRRAVDLAVAREAKVRHKFGELLMAELSEGLADAGEPPLLILQLVVAAMWEEASAEECQMLYAVMGWTLDPMATYGECFARRVHLADGAALAGLLMMVLAARDCADELLPADRMQDRPAGALARHFGIPLDRVLRHAHIAADGAQVADATDTFLAAHAGREVMDEQPASRAGEVSDQASARKPTLIDPDWKWPAGAV